MNEPITHIWFLFNAKGDCVGGPSLKPPTLFEPGWRATGVFVDSLVVMAAPAK